MEKRELAWAEAGMCTCCMHADHAGLFCRMALQVGFLAWELPSGAGNVGRAERSKQSPHECAMSISVNEG